MNRKENVIALYKYIKALCALKSRIVTNLDQQIWTCFLKDIPIDPVNITIFYRDRVEAENSGEDILLEVKKPEFQPCPQPPQPLVEWLAHGWDRYTYDAKYKETIGEVPLEASPEQDILEQFHDSAERVKAYEQWLVVRNIWVEKQRVIDRTRKFFTRLYQIHTDIEKDSEIYELMVGEGLLKDTKRVGINHPIMLKRVKISFDAKINIIRIHDTDAETELYTMLLQEISQINHSVIPQTNEDLHDNFYHPLDRNDTPDFLKMLIHRLCSDSKFISPETATGTSNDDRILLSLNPVFFVRKRMDGSVKAIEEIIKAIETTGIIPGHLCDIVYAGKVDIPNVVHEQTIAEQLAASSGESAEILLSKEANREQLEIAQRIENYNAVVVQGPPGTGKTHTIANLLGHFLAQGKSVLVTSHTKKALAVLKDKVPAGLQNLCVSVLDDTNLDMERSIDGISEYLSKYTSSELNRKQESVSRQRLAIIDKLAEVRKSIFAIKYKEFKQIVYNGQGYSPAEAAGFVRENAEVLSYIPGKVGLYHPLPANIEELSILYKSNGDLTKLDEYELACDIPNPEQLLTPAELTAIHSRINNYTAELTQIQSQLQAQIELDYTNGSVKLKNGALTISAVDRTNSAALEMLLDYIKGFKSFDSWMVYAVVDGRKGGGYKSCWELLITTIEDTVAYADSIVTDLLGKTIEIDNAVNYLQLSSVLEQMQGLFKKKGTLSKFDLFFHQKVKSALGVVKINGAPISNLEECICAQKKLLLMEKRSQTESYWNELMSVRGVPHFSSFGDEPERICRQQIPQIQRCLEWYQNEYDQVQQLLRNAGLNSELLFASNDFDSEVVKTENILKAIHTSIPVHIQLASISLDLKEMEDKITASLAFLENGDRKQSIVCTTVSNALRQRDIPAYTNSFIELTELYAKYSVKKQRLEFLSKLEPIAMDWANQIRNRIGIHGETTLPPKVEEAWKWKQFAGIIDELTAEPYEELQHKAVSLSKELRQKTALMAEYSAWYYLLQRTEKDLYMRQALQGWKKTVKKIGKGTGKNAPALKKQARHLMATCQNAVPAWIMPVNKALETLNPSKNLFDVIIVDEASQSDISALAIVYMGKKIIIVGDDKQVSPMAVGADIDKMNALMAMYIKEVIPNWHLYDLKSSLFDIAGTTFQPLMLREHFRCVPEIIGYSNKLSYDYKIKPLRDESHSVITPAVVSYRVTGGQRNNQQKINAKEVETIVALMLACMEQPEYDGASFGAISLLGDEQAQMIQQLILLKISPAIIEERRILCGNASHFQGDERNVIFLSMVDSNETDGPLTLAGEGADQSRKQRYNVAASRAKDQLWVVHSLDISKDLKQGDIRRDMLEYASNPKAFSQLATAVEAAAESPFEEVVGKSLVAAGYHLVQQWEVGAYRIDMVAIYKGNRVAIECDGEQYHSGEEKVREDMERQTILERLGWRFIRIRGSEYYRYPEKAMKRVIQDLNDYGIYPENSIGEIPKEESSSALLSRIKIRAAQIYDSWQMQPEEEPEFAVEAAVTTAIRYPERQVQQILVKEPSLNLPPAGRTPVERQNPSLVSQVDSSVNKKSIPTPTLDKSRKQDQRSSFSAHSSSPTQALQSKNRSIKTPTKGDALLRDLQVANINYIDKREKSGIIWVLYSEHIGTKIHAICQQYNFIINLERRGSTSTANRAAWRIMTN